MIEILNPELKPTFRTNNGYIYTDGAGYKIRLVRKYKISKNTWVCKNVRNMGFDRFRLYYVDGKTEEVLKIICIAEDETEG